MSRILDVPEVQALDSRKQLIRIPNQLDVPLTERIRQLIDTAAFRRLARISQLGLVSLVYPAAHHSRMEHSLGVYRMALLYLKQLSYDERFAAAISGEAAQLFLVAALLHDIGHWPFCHPLEDMRLESVPRHELLARRFLWDDQLATRLREDWSLDPAEVLALLAGESPSLAHRILYSMLSGPIDVDKMDYLPRDSLHAGVPYGQNFDQQRLIGSLCLNESGDGIAIRDKGRTAAEMMVFARYVMFSEVYWHHAVRAATAMLQRAFYLLYQRLDLEQLFRQTEHDWTAALMDVAGQDPASLLLGGLFGPQRLLYKRLAQYSHFEQRSLYQRLARRPYPWLVQCAGTLARRMAAQQGIDVGPHEVLIDAPPVQREVEFDIEVFLSKEKQYFRLGEVSPVIKTLAQQQFDDYVKRVRIFVHPRLSSACDWRARLPDLVSAAIDETPP